MKNKTLFQRGIILCKQASGILDGMAKMLQQACDEDIDVDPSKVVSNFKTVVDIVAQASLEFSPKWVQEAMQNASKPYIPKKQNWFKRLFHKHPAAEYAGEMLYNEDTNTVKIFCKDEHARKRLNEEAIRGMLKMAGVPEDAKIEFAQ